MHLDSEEISPMATITAECPRCQSVFYVDTDYPQRWLARYHPRAKPGETVTYPCPKHLLTEGDNGLAAGTCAGGESSTAGPRPRTVNGCPNLPAMEEVR